MSNGVETCDDKGPLKEIPDEGEGQSKEIPVDGEGPLKDILDEGEGQSKETPVVCESPLKEMPDEGEGQSKEIPGDNEGQSKELPGDDEGQSKEMPDDGKGPSKAMPDDGEGQPKEMPDGGEGQPKEMPDDGKGPSKEMLDDGKGPSKEMPVDGEGQSKEMPDDREGPSKEMPNDGDGSSKEMPDDGEGQSKETPDEGESPLKKMPDESQKRCLMTVKVNKKRCQVTGKANQTRCVIMVEANHQKKCPMKEMPDDEDTYDDEVSSKEMSDDEDDYEDEVSSEEMPGDEDNNDDEVSSEEMPDDEYNYDDDEVSYQIISDNEDTYDDKSPPYMKDARLEIKQDPLKDMYGYETCEDESPPKEMSDDEDTYDYDRSSEETSDGEGSYDDEGTSKEMHNDEDSYDDESSSNEMSDDREGQSKEMADDADTYDDEGPSYRKYARLEIKQTLTSSAVSGLLKAINMRSNFEMSRLLKGTNTKHPQKALNTKHSQKALNDSLLEASKNKQKFFVQDLLRKGANIEAVSEDGLTPFLIAAGNNNVDMMRCLLTSGADVNAVNAEGDSALILSTRPDQSLYVLKLLLEQRRIDTDLKNHKGYTALMKAVETKNIKATELLLDDYKRRNRETLKIDKESSDSNEAIKNCFGQELLKVASEAGMDKVISILLQTEEGESALMDAALRSDVEQIKILIDSQFYDVHKNDYGGSTFLQSFFREKKKRSIAIGDVDIPVVQLLLEKGVDINQHEKGIWYMEPPLETAIKAGSYRLVQLICKHDDRLDTGYALRTALDTAAEYDKADILQLLLDHGFRMISQERAKEVLYKSVVHTCLKKGHVNCTEILLRHGFTIFIPSAVQSAIDYHNTVSLKFLLERYGSEVKNYLDCSKKMKRDKTLVRAVERDFVDIICCLIEADNIDLYTPHYLLSCARSAAMVQLLVRNGANVNHRGQSGNTVLLNVILDCRNLRTKPEVVKALIEKNAGVNDSNCKGLTPLMAAAKQEKSSDVLNILLLHGADVNKKDDMGNTALLQALEHNCTENAMLLIKHEGAQRTDFEVQNHAGLTALIKTIRDRQKSISDLLIARGADVNVQDNNGDTALMHAARHGETDILNKIIERGANVNHQNKEGYSALMLAAKQCHKSCIEALLNAEADVNISSQGQNRMTAVSLLLECHSVKMFFTSTILDMLLDKGANASFVKPSALFDLIQSNQWKLIPKLVSGGFGPADVNSDSYLDEQSQRQALPQVSPFTFAFLKGHPSLARYFKDILFLTTSDMRLPTKYHIFTQNLDQRANKECENILDELCSQPMSLFKMSFVAVSSTIGCVPGRQEKVNQLPLPSLIKDKLLFKNLEVHLDIPESITPWNNNLQLGLGILVPYYVGGWYDWYPDSDSDDYYESDSDY